MDKLYLKEMSNRMVIVFILILVAFIFHRFLSSNDNDVIGAVLFIIFFTIGLFFYYINLFRHKTIHKIEFIFSIVFIFILAIIMFAIIYNEPIEGSGNYFKQDGIPSNLSFSDAIYFSTTTITTLGFGDISPNGVFKYFVMAEVLFGLLYIGTMIYFITRAIEKK